MNTLATKQSLQDIIDWYLFLFKTFYMHVNKKILESTPSNALLNLIDLVL